MKGIALVFSLAVLASVTAFGIDFKQAKFTQVVNDVKIISGNQINTAAINSVFQMPDILRTGPASRAELVAADDTITRVGANTIFSFDPAQRTIDLQQGSLLFHSPHGKGGGTIRTASATASVLGTTLIVSTTPNGGLKVLDLEGSVSIKFLNGLKQRLEPGQMTFVLPGGKQRAPIIEFRLDQQTKTSKLVNGFSTPLASIPLINQQIVSQLRLLRNGLMMDTRLLVGDVANPNQVQVFADPIVVPVTEPAANPPTFPPPPPPPNLTTQGAQQALQSLEATISGNILSPANVFVGISGFNITTDPNNFLGSSELINPFYGYPAHDITISTPTLNLSSYTQSATGDPWFDIVALNNMDITGSLTVNGMSSSDYLYFSAGNQLTIAPGSVLTAGTGIFSFAAFQQMTFSDDSFDDNAGGIYFESPTGITLENNSSLNASAEASFYSSIGSVDLDSSSVTAGFVSINAKDMATVNNTTLASSGDINITTVNSTIDLEQSTIDASGAVDVNSGGSLTLGTSINDTIQSGDGTILDAVGNITDYSTPITDTGGEDIEMDSSAGTLDVENCDLTTGGSIHLTSSGPLDFGVYVNIGSYAATQTFTGYDVNLTSTGDAVNIYTTSITAGDDITVNSVGTLTVDALLGQSELPDTFTAVGDISLTSSTGDVDVEGSSTLTSTAGNVTLTATAGSVNVLNSAISVANATSYTVNLTGPNGVTVSGSTINADPVNGTVNLTSTGSGSGMITVNDGTHIESGTLTLNSDGGILLDGSTGALSFSSSAVTPGTVNLTASGTASLNSVDLSSYGNVIISAHTVDLQNVTFAAGSDPVLKSALGSANFGSIVLGDVNFISNVKYGVNNLVGAITGIGQVLLAGTGITITTSGL
jgi:hypothetical protein